MIDIINAGDELPRLLNDEERLLLEAFLQQYQQRLGKGPLYRHRDRITREYLENRDNSSNIFVQYMAAMKGQVLRAPAPVPPSIPESGDARRLYVEEQRRLYEQRLQEFIRNMQNRPPADAGQQEDPLRINFNFNAYDAAHVLIPIAQRLDSEQSTDRFMRAAIAFLQKNRAPMRDINIEAAFGELHLPSPVPSRRIETPPIEMIFGLLNCHQGVFIGEEHINHNARQFLIDNMQNLHQQGVRTLFWELNPEIVEQFRTGNVNAQIREIIGDRQMQQLTALLRAAEAAGIQVVGYDSTDIDALPTISPTEYSEMQRRDRQGADIIRGTLRQRGGRYIVLGGYLHSGRFNVSDPESDGNDWGLPQNQPYQGLDALLDIPSVDFMDVPGGRQGQMYMGDGRFNDYIINTGGFMITDYLPAPHPVQPLQPSVLPQPRPGHPAIPPCIRSAAEQYRQEQPSPSEICLISMEEEDLPSANNLPFSNAKKQSQLI